MDVRLEVAVSDYALFRIEIDQDQRPLGERCDARDDGSVELEPRIFSRCRRFRDRFYRADVIAKVLDALDVDEAVRQADSDADEALDEADANVGRSIAKAVSVETTLPPVVEIAKRDYGLCIGRGHPQATP
jgi:hypothetical protein